MKRTRKIPQIFIGITPPIIFWIVAGFLQDDLFIMEYFEDGKITCGNIMGGYGPQLRHEGRVGEYNLEETEDGFVIYEENISIIEKNGRN